MRAEAVAKKHNKKLTNCLLNEPEVIPAIGDGINPSLSVRIENDILDGTNNDEIISSESI